MRKAPKEFLALLEPHIKSGEIHLEDGGRHLKMVRRDGHKRPLPGSPSDVRAILNFKSQLRHFLAAPVGHTSTRL